MKKKWNDIDIEALLDYSKEKFQIKLPIAKEIEHLQDFLFELRTFFGLNHEKIQKTKTFPRLFRYGWEKVNTIELPEDAVRAISEILWDVLNEKCNHLSELCGFEKEV